MRIASLVTAVVLGLGGLAASEPALITVQPATPGPRVSPTMYGIFFEDINFGADGGLYAELVKNRSFEFPTPLMGWSEVRAEGAAGAIAIKDQEGFSAANPRWLRIRAEARGYGAANEGFRGMGVQAGARYRFAAQVRGTTAFTVALVAPDGRVLAHAPVTGPGSTWRACTATLTATATEAKARLELRAEAAGTIDLDMVSLFPEATFKGRANGLRADMAQLLADLKPGFMRFPGGCIVEGRTLDNRYQWKTTIGPIEERTLIINRWNTEFKHRSTPDYFQSFGLGFFEYFQLCEDIGAEPLPILNCGMACQYNSKELAPLDRLDVYIQDAIDLIEFANGPATSRWGAKRAAMGHPAPFNLKFLGVGNEQWGQQYIDRYAIMAKALKTRHPEIRLVSSAGPSPDNKDFHFAWSKLPGLGAEIVDEHCYSKPDWFYAAATRYDRHDRTGPKVFMGEYAAHGHDKRNTWGTALAEAAFLTGLERNADVVVMSAYAPLFGHVDAWQWRPNLIWADNLRVVGTANYEVQKLFSTNRPDVVLPATVVQPAGVAGPKNGPVFAVAGRDERSGELVVKVVNAAAQELPVQLAGLGAIQAIAAAVLAGAPGDENELGQAPRIAPRPFAVAVPAGTDPVLMTLPAQAVAVLRIRTRP